MIFQQCTPIIPVADLNHAKEWFADVLGFETKAIGETGVHVSRDNVNIRLIRKADDMDMSDPRRQQSIYIDVDDVDTYYASIEPGFGPDIKCRAPFDRSYGMREIHIIYESLLIFFGSPLKDPQS